MLGIARGRPNARSRPATTPDGSHNVSLAATDKEIPQATSEINDQVPPILRQHYFRPGELPDASHRPILTIKPAKVAVDDLLRGLEEIVGVSYDQREAKGFAEAMLVSREAWRMKRQREGGRHG